MVEWWFCCLGKRSEGTVRFFMGTCADASIADYELVLSSTADGYKWDDGTNAGKLAIERRQIEIYGCRRQSG